MMTIGTTETMRVNDEVLKLIVHAIYNATTVDIPMAYNENRRATNNCFRAMRVDIINNNLETMLTHDGLKVHHFKRHGWEVCTVLDYNNKTAYFVVSEQNLKRIPKKQGRTWPHYLQSLLHEIHKGYRPKIIQESFLPSTDRFSKETYEADVEMILQDVIENIADWHLYIVAYEREGNEVKSATMYFLTSDFEEIDKKDLSEYIVPTYVNASNPIDESAPAVKEEETAEQLIKIKLKPRPAADDVNPVVKPEEYSDVG